MPNTIADKLTYLSVTKDAIKQSIIGKGVSVSDTDTFRSYANKIEAIQSGGSGTVNLPDGTKFAESTFTTVPDSIIPYLEQQTDLSYMFYNCQKLQTVPLFTSKVSTMSYMFGGCKSLTTVSLFDISYVFFSMNIFYGCSSLANLGGLRGLKISLDLHYCPLLTVDSVMNVINYAKDMTSSPKTLSLHQDVFNKLTAEQIATATAKGWNIAAK